MTSISEKSRKNAAAGARAWLARSSITRPTRHCPAPASLSQSDIAAQHHANLPLMKLYIYLLKSGKPLQTIKASICKEGRPIALVKAEELALIEYLRNVENSAFAVTEACIRNYASFIRQFQLKGQEMRLSQTWVGNFKKRHLELQCNRPKVKKIQRASAETDIPRMEGWFGGYEGTAIREEISTKNLGRGAITSSHIPEIISQAMNDLMEMSQYQQHAKKSPKHLAKTTQGVDRRIVPT
jgi:hypothetical protein